VWDDICTVLRRRYPLVEVVLSPTAVQGGEAAPAIIRALKRLYAIRDLDLVILARGGGSIEDLWGFNDEHVVRAVVASPVPIVVGVGHESDITLADFAADRRAPTPSAAAEIAVPDGTQLPSILTRLSERSATATAARLEAARRAVRAEGRALVGLRPDLEAARQRAAELLDRGHRALSADLARRRVAAAGLRDALRALGPMATLERGYAVARRPDGMILRDPGDVAPGDDVEVIVARGAVDARVTGTRPGDIEELLA
jgi:exodeoxyribonuclease VII large subunit